MANACTLLRVALLSSLLLGGACRGDGTFFSSILDGGGGSGGFGGFGGGFPIDSGMDATSVCVACGAGCFDCGIGCVCDMLDAGPDGSVNLPWSSPFPNTGAPGWRDSVDPLCSPDAQATGDGQSHIDLWSDARGVYALVRTPRIVPYVPTDIDAGDEAATCGDACTILTLYFNDGAEWQRLHTSYRSSEWAIDHPRTSVDGLINGPLLMRSTPFPLPGKQSCSLVSATHESMSCVAELEEVLGVATWGEDRAFALLGSGMLLAYDGASWQSQPFSAPFAVHTLWTDASDVIAVGDNALLHFTTPDEQIETLPFQGTTAVGGLSADDLWAGTSDGDVWHFDGQSWQQMTQLGGVTCNRSDAVRGIWVDQNAVYIHGSQTLQRWNGATFENLANWSCASDADPLSANLTIEDIWGNAHDELFIGLIDRRTSAACNETIVMRFDGTQFHRM